MYSCEFCGNNARYGHYCTPQVPFIYPESCYNQDFNFPQDFHEFQQQYLCCENCGGPHKTYQCQPMDEDYYHEQNFCYDPNSFGFNQFLPKPLPVINPTPLEKGMEELRIAFQVWSDNIRQKKEEEEKRIAKEQAAKDRYWNIPICYDDDEDYTIAITPVISTKEPDNSISMGDEHLDTIHSDENLVPIPSESEGLFDYIRDVPSCDNDHFDAESLLSRDILITSPKIDFLSEEFAGKLAPILPDIHEADFDEEEDICDDDTSSDDDDFEDIEYVDASPPNSELFSLEEVEDIILCDKLSNVYLLISKIEALNDNPTLSSFSYFDNSFSDHMEETRSGSTTSHADISLPEYDSFHFENDPDQGDLFGAMENNDDSISLPEYESFHFDLYDVPSFPRPPPEPPDIKVGFNIRPDTAVINNFDVLNKDACFNLKEGEIDFSQNVEDDDSFTFVIWTDKYGYIKNHKKTIKNGQARTRERKSAQKPEAKPKKSQASVK
ncbi:hypothetical protein Tco_0074244 [Tanacetum coccineum]